MSIKLPNFKCIIIGDPRTGKTSLLRNLSSKVTEEFNQHLAIHPIIFTTNFGTITFEIRDTMEQEFKGTLRDSYFHNADCAIILFDVTSMASYENVFHWHRRILTVCGKIPIVLCGNKIDIGQRRVTDDRVKFDYGHKLKFFEISIRDEESICAPFLFLAQQLTKKLNFKEDLTEIKRIGSETDVDLKMLHKMLDEKVKEM
ncbi:hypothetical protein PVAND_001471 [Polypedilum vanderplanki]|uniref:GTP-binding nuclear protein n=1 Tax=Polypedilum vanderplanki TaxID=319348 RepID=A0A9J6BN16_POLVA|nr:hypothetical protein PVAND_001471 [Polypedilum vanderplanki]